jgi:hypothetical protein
MSYTADLRLKAGLFSALVFLFVHPDILLSYKIGGFLTGVKEISIPPIGEIFGGLFLNHNTNHTTSKKSRAHTL